MSAVAEKTEKTEETTAVAAAVDEGFDVVEGGATQASSSVPLPSFLKQKEKWKGRVEAAKRDLSAVNAENELLRLQVQQLTEKQQKQAPKEADFENADEYRKAMSDFVADVSKRAVESAVRPKGERAERPALDDQVIRSHYERAAKLKAKDFDEAEDLVIDALGKDGARQIIEQFDNSEAVIYALGKNQSKLAEIAEELKRNPVKAVVTLTKYATGLQLKPRNPAPDPDTVETGSGGGGDLQRELDKLREKRAAGKATMQDVLKFKADARSKGISLE